MSAENNSTFIDIGSGFGKPVFHAAMQTNCYSKGVEVCTLRAGYTQGATYDFKEYYEKKMEKAAKKKAKSPVTDKSSP